MWWFQILTEAQQEIPPFLNEGAGFATGGSSNYGGKTAANFGSATFGSEGMYE